MITLDLPEQLATRIQPIQEQLPTLLTLALELSSADMLNKQPKQLHPTVSVVQEVIDFLINRPTPQEIIEFKVSSIAQTELELLLDKNRMDELTISEKDELDAYSQINHLMILLKSRARSKISTYH